MKIACTAGTMAFLCAATAFAGATGKAPKDWGKKVLWQQTAEVMSRPGILSAANLLSWLSTHEPVAKDTILTAYVKGETI